MMPREVIAFQWLMNHLNFPYKWGGDKHMANQHSRDRTRQHQAAIVVD